MTAFCRGTAAAFLVRAGLLTAALAVIAGMFGMHIMTGAHVMAGAHHGAAAHGMHSAAAPGGSSSCFSAGVCPEMSAMDAGCVLSPGTTSLTAPPPGMAPSALPVFGGTDSAGTRYSYEPDSPSPGDLCISRT